MIKVEVLHNEVRLGLNRVNTNLKTSINSVDIDSYLNKAKDYLLDNLSILAEKSKTFENILKELEVAHKELPFSNNSKFNCVIADLPNDYYKYLNVRAFGESNGCTGEIWNTSYYQRNDTSLYDPNWKPCWEWRSGRYNFSNDQLYFYYGDYEVTDLYMSYIRSVKDVAAVSLTHNNIYKKANGEVISENVDLDVNHPIFWRKICSLAIYYISKDMNGSYKETLEEILFNKSSGVEPNK